MTIVLAYLIFGVVLSCLIYVDMTNCGAAVGCSYMYVVTTFLFGIPLLWGVILIWILFRVVKDKLDGIS